MWAFRPRAEFLRHVIYQLPVKGKHLGPAPQIPELDLERALAKAWPVQLAEAADVHRGRVNYLVLMHPQYSY